MYNFAFFFNCTPAGQTSDLWQFRLKYISIDERVRIWCCVCGRAHQGLTYGFLLLQYSVVYTVESFSLYHILFISRFVFTWDDTSKSKRTSMRTNINLSWSIPEIMVRLAPSNMFQPSSKMYTNPSKAVLFCGSFMLFVFHVCHAVLPTPCSHIVVTCWERADLLTLLLVVLLVVIGETILSPKGLFSLLSFSWCRFRLLWYINKISKVLMSYLEFFHNLSSLVLNSNKVFEFTMVNCSTLG